MDDKTDFLRPGHNWRFPGGHVLKSTQDNYFSYWTYWQHTMAPQGVKSLVAYAEFVIIVP